MVATGQIKHLCVTVDDLPTVPYANASVAHEQAIVNGLLEAFDKHEVPAIGYVNAGKLFPNGILDSTRVDQLSMWLQAGYELGNHTYAHKDYHRVSFDEYAEDVQKGELVISGLAAQYGKVIQFFRHPYLRTGLDAVSSGRLQAFLNSEGYREAPVTIDNDEYLFALAFARAYHRGDSQEMDQIGAIYLDYMEAKLDYFEQQAVKLFGRAIDQTLLIHANYLNAQYLDLLLDRYEAKGYTFISQDEVLKDPAYQTPITVYGRWGISWMDRWAMSKGNQGDFFADDPKTPEFILELTR